MQTTLLKKTLQKIFYPFFYGHEVFRSTSPYNTIRVVDKKGYRFLIFDDPSFKDKYPEEIFQGCLHLKDPVNTTVPYADYFHFPFFLNPAIKSVYMVGLGCGLIPLQFLSKYPLEEFYVAEIDSEVVRVAAQHFQLPKDPRLKIFVQDGRKFLEKTAHEYDLIILDAFFARSLPFPLFTQQFFCLAKKRLKERGIFTININGALEGKHSHIFRSVYKTLQKEFPVLCFFAHHPEKPDIVQNIVIFSSVNQNCAAGLQEFKDMDLYDSTGGLAHLFCHEVSLEGGLVFDDNQGLATVDLYSDSLKN